MKKNPAALATLLLAAAILLLSGCVTTLGSIAANPQTYAEKVVSVKGTVRMAVKVPFTEYYILTFADEDGEAAVFTVTGHQKGEEMTMKAKVVAFPSGQMKANNESAVNAVADFLVEKGLASSENASESSKKIIAALAKVADTLGRAFFLIEQ